MNTMNYDLHEPTLSELASVFQGYLTRCFRKVDCKVSHCPDLTSEYHLTAKGKRKYNAMDAFSLGKLDSGMLIGAAAGPHFLSGVSSELVVNLSGRNGRVNINESHCGSYDETNLAPVSTPSGSTEFAMLGQMLLCEGQPGEVIEITVSERTRDGKFDALLREALTSCYACLHRPVGVGGVIIQLTGKCMFHVLPEFCREPLDSPDKVKNWLKFFEMDAPVVSVGTALSHDPQRWKLRLEHFHCFNLDRTKCGHCHFDTDARHASYKAYLVPASSLIRVDPPP